MGVLLKYCKICDKEYPLSEYYLQKRPDRPNDQYKCNACRRRRVNKCAAKNRKDRRARSDAYQKTLKGQFKKLRDMAKAAGREMEITLEQYAELRTQNCKYCGDDLPVKGGGLDRVNNSIGYTLINVVPCCVKCNVAKRHYSTEEFAQWILRAAKWAEEVVS